MCVAGKVRCLAPGSAALTLNAEYDILALSADGGVVSAAILDNNDAPFVASVNNSGFEFAELYVPVKVV